MKPKELNLTKNEIKEMLTNLKSEDIKHVYCGKRYSCRCGCKGIYYDNEKHIKELMSIALHDLELINEDDVNLITVNDKIAIIDVPDNDDKDLCTTIYLNNPIQINE